MRILKIKDICNNISDGNYSSKYPRSSEFVSEGIPFIRANNLKKGTVIWDDMRFISPEKHAELKKGHLKEKDVLVTTRGNIGIISLVPKEFEDANINAQIVRLECDPKIVLPEYLKLVMNTALIQNQLLRRTSGTALKQLPVGELQDVEIPIIPIETQKHIVSILEKAEKLKDKRQITNEDTNKIIQSVFYEMFGDIELVDYNKEQFEIIDGDRGINYPKSKDFLNEGFCLFLSTKNLRADGFLFNERQYVNEERDNLLRKGKLKRNDIVLTTRGTVGNVGLYDETVEFENIRINSGMVLLRPNLRVLIPKYLLYLIQMPIIRNQYANRVSGSAQPQLPIATLKHMKFLIPKLEQQIIFVKIVKYVESVRLKQKQSTDDINQLFDALMQKAFNGELVE